MAYILVTGAAGYIGSHFLRRCLTSRQDLSVLAVDNLSQGQIAAIPDDDRVNFFHCDISDEGAIGEIFCKFGVSAVVHFAASSVVSEAQSDPFKYFRNNVNSSLEFFKIMERHGVKNIVFSSSCAVYGDPGKRSIREDHVQRPINIYGTTKMMLEAALNSVSDASGWNTISLRYFNAAGADESGQIGESHNPETHLIPLTLQAALSGKQPVHVYGDDYNTPDGTCVRDYLHVNDIADAHLLALDLLESNPGSLHLNIGSSQGVSVSELIAECERVSNRPIERVISKRRIGDACHLVANCEKAREVLGWEPTYNLRRILETAWMWEKNRRY